MEFKQGTQVITSDGHHVGTVDRVVINPETKGVSHIVVRKGFLVTEDKVIPIELISTTSADQITLEVDSNAVKELPPFHETHYVSFYTSPPTLDRPTGNTESLYWYPPVGVAAWGGTGANFSQPALPVTPTSSLHIEHNIPESNIALKEGARVISMDDKHVGNIEQVIADSSTHHVTHIVISQGLLLKEQKLVPAAWIKRIESDTVRLAVEAEFLDRLPGYQGFAGAGR
jgi:uncharacterized protein YrrD